MEPPGIREQYPALDKAAEDVLGMLCTEFMQKTGSHVETIIAAAACLAGLSVLRNRSFDLRPYAPGTLLAYDPGRELEEIRNFLMAEAGRAGLDPSGGWDGEIPDVHRPKLSVPELTRETEKKFLAVCDRHRLGRSLYPHAAGLAALKFVRAADRVRLLDQNTGKALIRSCLAAGAKTVPFVPFV